MLLLLLLLRLMILLLLVVAGVGVGLPRVVLPAMLDFPVSDSHMTCFVHHLEVLCKQGGSSSVSRITREYDTGDPTCKTPIMLLSCTTLILVIK